MKGFLGCCYQRDVPPETIQNLRIFWGRKSVVFAHVKSVQLQLEKFLFFFRVGPPRASKLFIGWARPVASSLQAVKKFIFIFILHLGSCRI